MAQLSYIESHPKKLVGAACILENEKKELLLLKPSYMNGWLIPGGPLLPLESPKEGCVRKVKEEAGIIIQEPTLIGVTHSIRLSDDEQKYESVHFIFFGGILTQEQVEDVTLQEKMFTEFRFVPLTEAKALLSFPLNERVEKSLEAFARNTVAYIELKQEEQK